MTWHYLEGTEQRGPLTEADFQELVLSGKITNDTFVWREEMAEWLPHGQVRNPAATVAPPPLPVAGQVVCAECGGSFPTDETIRHGDASICAACKPVFLQKLKEGAALSGVVNYAGFGIRFTAYILDAIILAVPNFLIAIAFDIEDHLNNLLGLVQSGAYYTFFVGQFGATPGKMAARLVIVNADGSKVNYGKALARYFVMVFVSFCCTLGIGILMKFWDDQRRALHDRICGKRVIRK